jgi:hypothetical protein
MNRDYWLKKGSLRVRQKDIQRIKSMLESAVRNFKVIDKIKIDEDSATIVYREVYESIRQLGDAKLWFDGFEPLTHEVSIDELKNFDIKNKVKLNSLDRIMKIRHDINYRGYRASVSEAKEVVEFWDECCIEIVRILKSKVE